MLLDGLLQALGDALRLLVAVVPELGLRCLPFEVPHDGAYGRKPNARNAIQCKSVAKFASNQLNQ